MGKKLVGGLFAGLLGAGLYAAYQKMDENRKRQLKRDLREKTDELRDRAVDYAFYANDAVSDFKDAFKDQMDSAKDNVKDASTGFADKAKSFQTAKDSDDTDNAAEQRADQDDIIVDARDAFRGADQDDNDSSSSDETNPSSSAKDAGENPTGQSPKGPEND